MIFKRRNLIYDPAFEVIAEPGKDSTVPGPAGKDSTVPGPKGDKGDAGPGVTPRGEYRSGVRYQPNDIVRYGDATYVCREATIRTPGGRQWQLLCRDGEDGQDGVSQRGPRGLPGTTTVVTTGGTPAAAIFDSVASKGAVVYVSGDGHVDLALADSLATAAAVGLAASDVGAGQAGIVQTDGTIELDDWSAVLGAALLSPGSAVYLSAADAGFLTHTPPSGDGECVEYVGRALSTTELLIEPGLPILLDSDE